MLQSGSGKCVDFLSEFTCIWRNKKTAEQEIEKIEAENRDSISDYSLKEIFDFDFYGLLLNQGGIRFYNDVCGKINYHMNLYGQKHNIKVISLKWKGCINRY